MIAKLLSSPAVECVTYIVRLSLLCSAFHCDRTAASVWEGRQRQRLRASLRLSLRIRFVLLHHLKQEGMKHSLWWMDIQRDAWTMYPSFLQPEFGFSDTHSRASVLWLKCTGLAIHKFPDPRYSENSHKERFQWDFRFYERYIRKNGQWRKSCATPRNFQSANAKHSSAHALTHGTWKSCIASQWRYFLCISNRIYSVFFLFFIFMWSPDTRGH